MPRRLFPGDEATLTNDLGDGEREEFDALVVHSHGFAELYTIARRTAWGATEQAVIAVHPHGGWWLVRDWTLVPPSPDEDAAAGPG